MVLLILTTSFIITGSPGHGKYLSEVATNSSFYNREDTTMRVWDKKVTNLSTKLQVISSGLNELKKVESVERNNHRKKLSIPVLLRSRGNYKRDGLFLSRKKRKSLPTGQICLTGPLTDRMMPLLFILGLKTSVEACPGYFTAPTLKVWLFFCFHM